MTWKSGSMNCYSKEPFTQRLLPGLQLALSERFGQPLCLMSPIGWKASVKREISPSHLAHSHSPPSAHCPAMLFGPQYWGYLHKNFLARLAPALQAQLLLLAAHHSCLITWHGSKSCNIIPLNRCKILTLNCRLCLVPTHVWYSANNLINVKYKLCAPQLRLLYSANHSTSAKRVW